MAASKSPALRGISHADVAGKGCLAQTFLSREQSKKSGLRGKLFQTFLCLARCTFGSAIAYLPYGELGIDEATRNGQIVSGETPNNG
jgi:hypothetical protein